MNGLGTYLHSITIFQVEGLVFLLLKNPLSRPPNVIMFSDVLLKGSRKY